MIKRLLALDGVIAVSRFRDDGAFIDGHGLLPVHELAELAHFAHDYKRIVQGNADQLSMFTQLKGWTPPGGWIVRGANMTVCSVGNLVCVVDNAEGNVTEVLDALPISAGATAPRFPTGVSLAAGAGRVPPPVLQGTSPSLRQESSPAPSTSSPGPTSPRTP